MPPEGACRVRLKTRFARKGGTPVIVADEVTEEAVQAAIDESRTLAKYFSYFSAKTLGERPWDFQAELWFIGSDGQSCGKPELVECTYFGPEEEEKPRSEDAQALVVVECIRAQAQTQAADKAAWAEVEKARILAESETKKAEFACRAAEAQAQSALFTAAVQQAPNNRLIAEVATMRQDETGRANQVTADFAALLQRGQQQAPPTPPREFTQKLADVSGALLPWVPIVKGIFLPN